MFPICKSHKIQGDFQFHHKIGDPHSHGLEFCGWNVSLPEGGEKKKAEQPVQLKSMEIFPGISVKLNVGTRSVKMAGNGPWRIPRHAALNWI